MNYTSRILRNLFYHTKTDFSIVLNDIRNERDSIASYAHFHNASFVPPGAGLPPLTDFSFRLVAFLSLPPCPLLVGFLPAVCRKPFCFLRREVCPGLFNRHKLFATLSSEEFILFAFSYTESCRYSINVLN